MTKYYSLLICVLLSFSCSDDDPTPGCFQDEERRIVATVNGIIGTVILNEVCGYFIDPEEQLDKNPTGLLSPCNLESDFRLNGSRVIFSGFIYESFDTEDICADFFEISDIEMISEN